jgi:uncharacterized membrane protein YesL
MMQDINYQDFFSKLDRISGFAIINLLWLISSAFIIILPAATVGLFAVMIDMVRGKNSEAFTRFFGAMRQYGIKASVIGLIDAVLLGLVVFNFNLIPQMGLPPTIQYPFLGIMLFVGLLVVMVNVYIWILLVTYDLTLKTLMDVSITLSIAHVRWTAWVLFLTIGVLSMGLVLPALVSVLILFSSGAYIMAWGAWHIIQDYDAYLCQLSTQERVLSS